MKLSSSLSRFASFWGKFSFHPIDYTEPAQLFPAFHSVAVGNGVNLRILPLGDSITYGFASSDGNGYRLDLQDLLSENVVQYIGSVQSGNMTDNFNEGHSGAIISEIADYANLSLNKLPNVVLLMAGTNDMNKPVDPSTAPDRLGSLIDEIFSAVPSVTVLVSTLIPSLIQATEANIEIFNSAIGGLLATRAIVNKKVIAVNMTKYITVQDLADGLHPSDVGYSKIASAWYDALQQAALIGWLSPPQDVPILLPRAACSGSVLWKSRGLVAAGVVNGDSTGADVFFADINGDGKDDYLVLDPMGETKAWFNQGPASDGSISWSSVGEIATGVGSPRSTIHFADLNGDGLADYLTVDPTTGAVAMWQNGGGFDSRGVYMWTSLGKIADGVGVGAGVVFADMDGDGKADYIWLDTTGATSLWVNGGMSSTGSWNWYSKGVIATGVGAAREDVRLADIDGDGKADYLWINSTTGETKMWRNGGMGSDENWIWTGVGEIATGVGFGGAVVRFSDMAGLGRADYLAIVTGNDGVEMWENDCAVGSGGGSGSTSTVVSVIVSPTIASTTVTNSPSPIVGQTSTTTLKVNPVSSSVAVMSSIGTLTRQLSSTSTNDPSTTTSPGPQSTSSSKSLAGPIAGGVVGGLAGIALISAVVVFLVMKQGGGSRPMPVNRAAQVEAI